MNPQRIAASIALVMIVISVTCFPLTGAFPALQELFSTISTITFLIAASVLGYIIYQRNKAAEEHAEQQPTAPADAEPAEPKAD